MIPFRNLPRPQPKWRLLLGVLCIGLVLVAGILSVTHSHTDGVSHSDCGQCITAHATVDIARLVAQLIVALLVILVAASAVTSRVQSSLFRCALFTRPPPAVAHLA